MAKKTTTKSTRSAARRSLQDVVRRRFVAQLYADADTLRVFEDDEAIADLHLPGGVTGDKVAGREALRRNGYRQPSKWTPTDWGWEARVTSAF